MGALVTVLQRITIVEILSLAMVQKISLTSRIYYVLWRMSSTFCCNLKRWRRLVSSTKHTAVIFRLVYSKKCTYMQDVFVIEHIMSLNSDFVVLRKAVFYAYAYINEYTQHKRTLYAYINARTNTHLHWKPLHPPLHGVATSLIHSTDCELAA